jgi:hypothetical protein
MEDRIHGAMVEEPVQERDYEQSEMRTKEYRPNRMESLREYEITLRFLSVGVVVRVGCKEIAFTSVKEAMEAVNKYVDKPYEESKRWRALFDSAE